MKSLRAQGSEAFDAALSRLPLPSAHENRDGPATAGIKVEPGQVWLDRGGQPYKVVAVAQGIATIRRCGPDDRMRSVLHQSTVLVEGLQAGWSLDPSDTE